MRELHRRSIWQLLGGYAVVSWIVLQVTETLGSLVGLPLWFGRSVLFVLLLILPLLLFTSFVQGRRAPRDEDEPAAARLRRLFSWRHAFLAAAAAFGLLGLFTAGYMGMRALGVGPGAPLIASGVLEEREPLLLARFTNRTADSLLGGAVTEAFRVDLAQSPVVGLLPIDEVDAVLVRMRMEPGASLDEELARELALRAGVKAVVAGEINPVGSSHVISVKVVTAESGRELAAYRETASGRDEIIAAVDRLSKRLRARIGESLASVRRSPPLPSVTTGSLEALELYAGGLVLRRRGHGEAAAPLFERAVAADTAFASAYRALALVYLDSGDPASARRFTDLAHRFGARLPEAERYRTSASYHGRRGRYDSTAYYYGLLRGITPDSNVAINNLGDAYEWMGRYGDALDLYRLAVQISPDNVIGYVNLASAARTLGLHALADSSLAEMVERFPPGPLQAQADAANAFYAGETPHLEEIVGGWAGVADLGARAGGRHWLASVAGMRGEALRALALADSAAGLYLEQGSPLWATHAVQALVNIAWATEPQDAAPYLERYLPEFIDGDLSTAPRFSHSALGLFATGFALAGKLEEAGQLLALMDSVSAGADFRATGIGERARALVALKEDRPQVALEHLERSRIADYGRMTDHSRLLLAEAYAELGRLAEAAAHYDTLSGTYGVHWSEARAHPPLQPISHERLGGLYLALGDTTAALRHLATFVELWSGADPELQGRVAEAQEVLDEIFALRG